MLASAVCLQIAWAQDVSSGAYVGTTGSNDSKNVYDDVATALSSKDADIITDFKSKKDQIQLEAARYSGLGGAGKVSDVALAQGPGGGSVTAQTRLIFDTATGQLSYDAYGNGAQEPILIATLQGVTALLPLNILVY